MLITGALNPRPAVALRLLIWTTPALPLGVWMAAVAAGGAVLSGGATALALRQPGPALRRQVRREGGAAWEGERFTARDREDRGYAAGRGAGSGAAAGYGEGRFETDGFEERGRRGWRNGAHPDDARATAAAGGQAWAGPDRRPGEPPPTVSVPFRVIRQPAQTASAPDRGAGTAAAGGRRSGAMTEPVAEPVAAWEDWGSDNLEDW